MGFGILGFLLDYAWMGKVMWNTLPKIEDFYSNLNIEDITDLDCNHAKRICKDFNIKNVEQYHDLYLKNITIGWCFWKL